MKKLLSLVILLSAESIVATSPNPTEELPVKITKDIPYVETMEDGEKIWVMRIQNPNYRLTDDYTKTSRLCPPFCIQPNHVEEDIKNIGELELLNFMQHEVKEDKGLIIDARLFNWYTIETIPSAINLPFNIIEELDKPLISKIFQVFGMILRTDGTWDFSHIKKLAIFCNGVWCEQSKHLIDGLLKYGYPKDHILYYRGGFQGWKLLGLTTVMHSSKIQ